MFFLLEASPSDATQWILPAVLLVLVVGIFVLNYFRSKKNQEAMKNMVDGLKVGDNVKTYSGIYGKIIEIVETTDGKVAILETGSEKNKGIFSIDINAIYGIDEKKPVVYDAEGNIIEPEGSEGEQKEELAVAEDLEKEKKKQPKKNNREKTEKEKLEQEPNQEEVKDNQPEAEEPLKENKKTKSKKASK